MRFRTLLLILLTFSSAIRVKADSRVMPSFEPKGKYALGFRTFTLDDPWNKNNLILNIPNFPQQRRILVNVWYPARDHASRFQHYDYWQGSVPYEKAYLEAYGRFRRLFFFQESFSQTAWADRTPVPQNPLPSHPKAFERTIAGQRNAEPADGTFPILFYHSGAQGGFEENAPLLEYFAQHGYISVAVAGSSNDGEIDSTARSDSWMWNDLLLAYEAIKNEKYADPLQVGLVGFSAGAQANLRFLLKQGQFRAAVLLDTTYENQDFMKYPTDSLQEVKDHGIRVETPLLILSEIAADFKENNRFRLYEPISRAPRIMVDFGKDVPHDDFTWHGLIKRSNQPVVDEKALEAAKDRYEFIAKLSLNFLNEAFSSDPDWSRFDDIFQKHPSNFVYREITKASSSTQSFQELSRWLQVDPASLKLKLREALQEKSIDPLQLSGLISHVRYTDSSYKALQICEALPREAGLDELRCASIALENDQPDLAQKYVKAFLKHHKKPKKTANEFDHWMYSDAHKLQKLIKLQKSAKDKNNK